MLEVGEEMGSSRRMSMARDKRYNKRKVVERCGEKTPARENYSESSSFSCLLIISIGGFRI
jgi:hypothetical protein